jgi:hypothetical protein
LDVPVALQPSICDREHGQRRQASFQLVLHGLSLFFDDAIDIVVGPAGRDDLGACGSAHFGQPVIWLDRNKNRLIGEDTTACKLGGYLASRSLDDQGAMIQGALTGG